MENETKKYLWEEFKIVQTKIDKFDSITFRIKNWFITIFIALTGYSILENKEQLLLLNIAVIFIFYIYENTYRIINNVFLDRSNEIEELLRESNNNDDSNKAPNFTSHIKKEKPYTIKIILSHCLKNLDRYRVSFIYISAFFINSVISSFNLYKFLAKGTIISDISALTAYLSVFLFVVCFISKRIYMMYEKSCQ